ncbi:MAG: cyclic nucleotide-binding domain-containing protein [Deltaproteobacteria bacterium]|nr:cyclic nucleotide-binding domain-containing protein [Deltaproteobacteria bacterium]
MLKTLRSWLNIYADETGLFFWTLVLRFLLVGGFIILSNYADTTFLSRYDVQKMPIIMFLNAILAVGIISFLSGFIARMPGTRLLAIIFIFCGTAIGILRLLIPMGFPLIYPVLYVLKTQFESVISLLYLNLTNDLFNVRQSKRLFPLISAGAIVSQIILSFGTPYMARTIDLDNLLLIYTLIMLAGAVVLGQIGKNFPTLLVKEKRGGGKKKKPGFLDQFKRVRPMIRGSLLIKILILLFLLPNVVLPIMNFQFNVVVDESFNLEPGKLAFLSYFRGTMSAISLVILLFVGRFYGRWGLPTALMIHPVNYILAFVGLLLRFNKFAAGYARLSTNVLKSTIHLPARAVLTGLLPSDQRAVMMPFLRGYAIKAGTLTGAGLMVVFNQLFHPRYLSLVALPVVVAMAITPYILKRNYSRILLNLISKGMLDLKSMEKRDMDELFRDRKIREQLMETFRATRGKECLWYAGLMKSLAVEELDANILNMLQEQDDQTRIGLLALLSSAPEAEAAEVFPKLVDYRKPALMAAIITAANRLDLALSWQLNREAYAQAEAPEVRALAAAGLCRREPEKYCNIIDTWLQASSRDDRLAGVIAAGASKDARFVEQLKEILAEEENHFMAHRVIQSLHQLDAPGINGLVKPFLGHDDQQVRRSALEAFNIEDDDTLRVAIAMMGDASETLHRLAREKIKAAEYQNGQLLIESLNIPRRKIREGVFDLLETLNIGDIEAYRFARTQLNACYAYLVAVAYVKRYPDSEARSLLVDHLEQKSRLEIENVLRVLALQDKTGQMKIVGRGIYSADGMQRANSMEALDDLLDRSLSKILLPLLGGASFSEKLAVGRRHFKLPAFGEGKQSYLEWLEERNEWLSLHLYLNLIAPERLEETDRDALMTLEATAEDSLKKAARKVLINAGLLERAKERDMAKEVVITDKILLLKKIEMFEGLTVSELAAVGSVTEEVQYEPGEIVIKRGDMGETMYLIISGEVSVHIGDAGGNEIEVDRIREGDYFGEMALFEDVPRSATIRTESESRLLVLHKQEFNEIVREYPQIALTICKVLSSRIRTLHEKIKQGSHPG